MADKDCKKVNQENVPEDLRSELLHDGYGNQYLVNSDYIQQEQDRTEPSADKEMELKLARELLSSNLRQLTQKQKDVLYYTMQGLTQPKIAKKLGISVSGVKEHLDLARKKLAKIITGTKEVLKEGLEHGTGNNNSADS